jgi:hypothetical protein
MPFQRPEAGKAADGRISDRNLTANDNARIENLLLRVEISYPALQLFSLSAFQPSGFPAFLPYHPSHSAA